MSTETISDTTTQTERVGTPRRYAMCRPEHFSVDYAINPWMTAGATVDVERALTQWQALRQAYLDLGHTVDLVSPEPGLPDMVFAANGGLIVDGVGIGSRFTFPERAAEGPAYERWMASAGLRAVHTPSHTTEGEGDFLTLGDRILAGTGFRTSTEAHAEVAGITGREVITLELVDPRFYHLDTALAVLSPTEIAYYPAAFSPDSRALLAELFPDAIIATAADAEVLGLNAVSDGRHVVISPRAVGLIRQLTEHGFVPVAVDVSELLAAGGGIKCATLEVRS